MRMKSASIYERKGVLFFCPSSMTTDGVGIDTEPVLRLETAANLTTIGESLLRVLNESRNGVPHPSDWKAQQAPS